MKAHAAIKREHRQLPSLEAERVPVEIHGAAIGKTQQRQRPLTQARQIERVDGCWYTVRQVRETEINGIADHLRPERREALTQLPVRQVVQGHPVPHPRLLHQWRQRITHLRKSHLQCAKPNLLLGRGMEGEAQKQVYRKGF